MKKGILFTIGCLAIILLSSWGRTGHYIISTNASLSYTSDMEFFVTWASYIADHASDADRRKSEDPSESPKHYIDIDYYYEFVTYGYIPKTLNEAIAAHGSSNVYNWGILPWATMATYDSLVHALTVENWDKAKYFASDLGHYVGDGHMPLHLTKNYDGQLTDNYGIHSRYESTMVNGHENDLWNYSGSSVSRIADVPQYVLDYIYANNKYVDSVLIADNYAKNISSDYSSAEYEDALWNKTKDFTLMLFSNASHSLAELFYTAWLQADDNRTMGISETNEISQKFTLMPVMPNPVSDNCKIFINVHTTDNLQISLYNISGKKLMDIGAGNFAPGWYKFTANVENLPSGMYVLRVSGNQYSKTQRIVVQH